MSIRLCDATLLLVILAVITLCWLPLFLFVEFGSQKNPRRAATTFSGLYTKFQNSERFRRLKAEQDQYRSTTYQSS